MEVSKLSTLCFAVCCVLFGGVWSNLYGDDPNDYNGPQGIFTITTMESGGSCGWEEALSRFGSDNGTSNNGQLTIEVDTCQIAGNYEIYSFPQSGGAGGVANLIPGDLIIVWDEDGDHGSDEQYKNFDFTGSYVPDPNAIDPDDGYIRLTTTDPATNWAVYRVTESGTFTKGNEGTNEHEIIHFLYVNFTKVDNVGIVDPNECVSPGYELIYTICYENISNGTLEDVYIIDYLPAGVTHAGGYWETDPLRWIEDTNYDPNTHTYKCELGTLEPNDIGCVTVTVTVSEDAEPSVALHNVAEIWDDNLLARDTEDTLVCCWSPEGSNPDIIYVDADAPGPHTGVSWQYAYADLQDAIDRINRGCPVSDTIEIWAAEGTYKPGDLEADSFVIPDGVVVYGGFAGNENNLDERDIQRYETIFDGFVSDDGKGYIILNTSVVTMGYESLLDGVTVTQGEKGVSGDGSDFTVRNCNIVENSQYGIYVKDCDAVIENCKVAGGVQYGIYAQDGDLTVKWCGITDNGWHGIEHKGNGFSLTVENSQIKRNAQYGVFTDGSIAAIKNSVIASNGSDVPGFYGMRIKNPTDDPVLYNNTIVYNAIEGIAFVDNVGSNWPDIQNCIVYFNNDGSDQMAGMIVDDVADYSCIQGCSELNNNINDVPGFAYTVEPDFVEPYPDNYHLAYDSPCVDTGSPNLSYTDQVDIDGEDRVYIYEGSVDIGADEVYSCDGDLTEDDIYNALDWNADGIVNYEEFEYFSLSWLSHDPNDPALYDPDNPVNDPNDPAYIDPDELINWNHDCNLDDTGASEYAIDLADILMFCEDNPQAWLWVACWKQAGLDRLESMMMAMGGGAESMMIPISMGLAMLEPEPEPESAELTEEQLVHLVKGIYRIMASLDESFQADDLTQDELDKYVSFFGSILLDLQEEYLE